MIITAQVQFTADLPCDEVWQITRSGRRLISDAIWVPELAPSQALYQRYLSAWKGQPGESWWPEYRDVFFHEMSPMLPKLRDLWRIDKTGKIVGLTCFCGDPRFCHRSLISEFLRKYGIQVREYQKGV